MSRFTCANCVGYNERHTSGPSQRTSKSLPRPAKDLQKEKVKFKFLKIREQQGMHWPPSEPIVIRYYIGGPGLNLPFSSANNRGPSPSSRPFSHRMRSSLGLLALLGLVLAVAHARESGEPHPAPSSHCPLQSCEGPTAHLTLSSPSLSVADGVELDQEEAYEGVESFRAPQCMFFKESC